MKRVLLLFLFLPFQLFSQNLLVNGGFEEENSCSEYQVNCAPEGWIYTVPSFIYYFKDKNLAHTGEHFIALIAGHSNKPYYRTYVRSRLLCGLRAGHTYQIQFQVKSHHNILDSLGILFTSYDFLFEKRLYKTITPSVYLTSSMQTFNAKDTGWQQVSINYTADGTESFMTLGNFSRNSITGSTGIDRENNFFVLIDDISMQSTDPNEHLCSDWREAAEDIYTQDERHQYLDRLIQYKRRQPVISVKNTPTIVQKIDTIVLPDILFETGSAKLSSGYVNLLDSVNRKLQNLLVDSLVVEGHTDSVGSFADNKILSLNRATAVGTYFTDRIENLVTVLRGWADERPVADNRTRDGRQKNRRVVLYLYVRE